jgi:hypothetical protein
MAKRFTDNAETMATAQTAVGDYHSAFSRARFKAAANPQDSARAAAVRTRQA